ncbi:hypothetical protein F5I97DRAFT_1829654 [Phlebopus sp. FC_14]|nr:hypothetical protein F5I97DRAFT_1829654 [Phlebopus sp. FC_14]
MSGNISRSLARVSSKNGPPNARDMWFSASPSLVSLVPALTASTQNTICAKMLRILDQVVNAIQVLADLGETACQLFRLLPPLEMPSVEVGSHGRNSFSTEREGVYSSRTPSSPLENTDRTSSVFLIRFLMISPSARKQEWQKIGCGFSRGSGERVQKIANSLIVLLGDSAVLCQESAKTSPGLLVLVRPRRRREGERGIGVVDLVTVLVDVLIRLVAEVVSFSERGRT